MAMETKFLDNINANLGIIYKVCNVYAGSGSSEREDLFQEILYQLWKSYPHFKGFSKFSTWMYRVALNTAMMHSQFKKNSIEIKQLELSHEQIEESVEQFQQDEKIQQLYKMIGTLSKVDKAIILLFLEDHSYEEIANMTGLSKSNVSVRLVRIKRNLKEKMVQSLNSY
jgi:RNA polymerase sigma-70 factor (ECF subfamily)